jgi:transcription-repair coupling factor (superfamily II helicase)
MIDFVEGKINVLVCTTIIESGLDIPNANTILIDNADRFGLAELHQLRGRVGRYKHRAFAYMLLPASRPITPTAARRLKAIEEYSHLGSGFRIALRDLEIRGAGNILGAEQSGHIQIVGYQMYCQLLAEAVKRLKNEPLEKPVTAVLDLKTAAYIPKNYIPMERSRMEVYRKIAAASSTQALQDISAELTDVYGPVPVEVKELLQVAELRIAADKIGIKSIVAGETSLEFSFADDKLLKNKTIFDRIDYKTTVSNSGTVYVHLPKNYFEPKTLLSVLRKMLKVA